MSETPVPQNPRHGQLVVALTGSIGSGKSAVADLLAKHGTGIIDADLLAREVVAPGMPALTEIAQTFGKQFILPSGELDRKALGAVVFADPGKKTLLEKITHPRIRELFLTRLGAARKQHNIITYVVPLLFESGFAYSEVDVVVVVTASKEACLARVMSRDGSSRELAERKFNSQIDPSIKASKADFVVTNDGSLEDLSREVSTLYNKLLKLTGGLKSAKE